MTFDSGPMSSGSLSAVSATPVAFGPRKPGQSVATRGDGATKNTDDAVSENEMMAKSVTRIERLLGVCKPQSEVRDRYCQIELRRQGAARRTSSAYSRLTS